MNILANGSTPVASISVIGRVYHGPFGIGLFILLTLHGNALVLLRRAPQCRPSIQPATASGNATNNHINIILTITKNGIVLIVSYHIAIC
jgi:hypothetical protein